MTIRYWFCKTCEDLTTDYPCAACGGTAGFENESTPGEEEE